ncbi:MAG: efflux RND transporter periplasmic adaptor subunit, partial [Candidatus Dormibacteria bacterium]
RFLSRRRRTLVALIAVAVIIWLGLRFVRAGSTSAPLLGTAKVSAAGEPLPVVTVVEPVRRVVAQTLTLPASVEAIEKATLYAKVSGYLQWIKVDKGDRIKKGEILAQLEVPEVEKEYQSAQAAVAEAQAEYERAEADANLKQVTYQRTQGVRDSEPTVVSPQEVDIARATSETAAANARLAQARLEKARAELGKLQVLAEFAKVTAPFDGVVTERFVDPGALIQAGANSSGSPVVSVARIDQVRVYISVPEVDVAQITRGVTAQVRLDALPGRQFTGKVTRFADAVDPQSRTMKTEVDLPNPNQRILSGMFGSVTLELSTDPNAVFLPDQSVRQDSAGSKFVYVVENDRLRKVAIQTGQDNGTVTQVFGLRKEQAIVLSGGENLQEGTLVKAAKGSMQMDSRGVR